MNLRAVILALGSLAWSLSAWAEKGPEVLEIKVRGNAKVETDAILSLLKTAKAKPFDAEVLRLDVEALHKLRYFKDIRVFSNVFPEGISLSIELEELPAIIGISFEGLKELNEEDFKNKLDTKLYTIADEATLNNDLRNIEKIYLEKGYYLASANYQLTPQPGEPNEVQLSYVVVEGGKIQVGDVDLLGVKYFSHQEIVSKFMLQPKARRLVPSGQIGVYNDEFLKRDADFIDFMYRDQGFAEVKVARPIVTLDPDREYVRLTFEVEEGIQYNVSAIDLSGDLLYPKEELFELMRLKPGKLFRYSQFRSDITMLMDKYGDLGYAFADVNPLYEFDREKKTVKLNYEITKGEKVYFGYMRIIGNSKTRDNVIRREFEVSDGALYSGTRLSESKKNVERLGYFEEVQAIKQRDETEAEMLNYSWKLKEKPTGQIQLAVGYSPSGQVDGGSRITGNGKYREDNQSGKGWQVSFGVRYSNNNDHGVDLDLFEPRVNDSKWSLGLNSFYSSEDRAISSDVEYTEKRYGAGTNVGREIWKGIRWSLGYEWSRLFEKSTGYLPQRFRDSGISASIILALNQNKTDNNLDPTEGFRWSISERLTGLPHLGGTRHYRELKVEGDYLYPFDLGDSYRTFVKLRSQSGWVHQERNFPIPFSARYRLGGQYDLRGYRYKSLGPQSYTTNSPFDRVREINEGGNRFQVFQLEYFIPLIPEANIRALIFADAGRVFNDDENLSLAGFNRDLGFGLRWMSPMGPLRFEWAYPIKGGRLGELEFIFAIGN